MVGVPAVEAINYPYTDVDLSMEIDTYPTLYGRLAELDVFPDDAVRSEFVEIGFRDGKVTVLPAVERGDPPTQLTDPDERSIILKVPHFPAQGTIKPQDLQNRYMFGSGRQQVDNAAAATTRVLMNLRRQHDITDEYLRMGALKGVIHDGKYRIIYNLYDVFSITKKTIDFELGTPETNVLGKCEELEGHLDDNLRGETMGGIYCLVSSEFFNKLVSHPNVEKYYLNWQAATALAQSNRQVFRFGNIDWEAYRGKAPDATKTTRRFIAANEGHAWPTGTQEAFRTYRAPPYHMDYVNTEGVDILVSQKILDHGRGVELFSQANALPVCSRPELLVEVTTSN